MARRLNAGTTDEPGADRPRPSLLQTGVPNLDLILGGGAPSGEVLLVTGPAGAGKTTLTLQAAFHVAAGGGNAVYATVMSEPPQRVITHLRGYSFYDETLVGKRLFLLELYPLVRQDLARVADALVQAVRERSAALLVLDGLMTIRDLHGDEPALRAFLYGLGAALATLDCVTVMTSSAMEPTLAHPLPELTMADGVVHLGTRDLDSQTVRTIRVVKMRGLAPLLGLHSMRINDQGITVFPRMESISPAPAAGLNAERVSLGIPEVDAMFGGGVTGGSCTVLSGGLGTGKTLACLSFLIEGARRGEKGLLLGFGESPRQLVDKARSFGMDLDGAVRSGQVVLMHRPPLDLVADEILWELRREMQRSAPRRVALDGLADLESAVHEPRRIRGYMAGLMGMLQEAGVTALMVKEVPQVIGPALDFSDTPLAVLAENLILMRYVEFRCELFRIISILKMRNCGYDASIRQYTIDEAGLHVLARQETAEGLLTGIARLPAETRVRR